MATDEDLKLGDLLRYHMRDAEAAKGLLYRRMRCLANLETANKNLDKARAKNKDIATVSSPQFYLGQADNSQHNVVFSVKKTTKL